MILVLVAQMGMVVVMVLAMRMVKRLEEIF